MNKNLLKLHLILYTVLHNKPKENIRNIIHYSCDHFLLLDHFLTSD
jgi:hypothetical protein